MWTLPTLPLLSCILTATFIGFAAATDTCANCTYNATGANCTSLKIYLGCLETASGAGASCNLSAADASKIKKANCSTALPQACSCQKEFWGTDGTDDEKCRSLTTYTACLNSTVNDTCTSEFNVSTLVANADSRYAACKTTVCSSKPCKNGGRCNVTDNVGNYTCDCTSGYSGWICNGGPCVTFNCNDKGTCEADKKDKTKGACVCDTGFTGDHCENGAPKEISLLSLLATLLAANILRMTLT